MNLFSLIDLTDPKKYIAVISRTCTVFLRLREKLSKILKVVKVKFYQFYLYLLLVEFQS